MTTKYGGYMGKILRIDLTTEIWEEYPWSDRQRKETLGGKALAYRILADHLTGNELLFSEENLVILSTGPLTGTGAPGSARFEITAISPQSGLPASSNCGGNFGIFLKKAGYDALILRGRCKTCRWLEIRENGVRFRDALPLWGLGTRDTIQHLVDDLPEKKFGSLCIGPAGEEQLPCATVISDGHAAGRAGFGAVLGWKNLKAITVYGNQTVPLYHSERAEETIRKWRQHILNAPVSSDPAKTSSCPGCPIRCKGKGNTQDPVFNDLGLDSMDAPKYSQWLITKLGYIPEFPSKKHGQRRNQLYQTMLDSLALPDSDDSFAFYLDITEALSASGLCLFTAGTCFPAAQPKRTKCIFANGMHPLGIRQTFLYPLRLLRHVAGYSFSLRTFLSVGRKSHQLQNNLHSLFSNANAPKNMAPQLPITENVPHK